jgi:hypothetical protein
MSFSPPMNINDLQNEINHLLFLYFTSIGVIQRDYDSAEINKTMDELIIEIRNCKDRIDLYLDSDVEDKKLPQDFNSRLNAARAFVEDGFSFIDHLIN